LPFQRDHHNQNSDHIVHRNPLAVVHNQNVFLAEDMGMVAWQFWAKWPDPPQQKQDSLSPNLAFSLEVGITTRLDMGEFC